MKTIIAGSRWILDIKLVIQAVEESGFDITEVVCGCARGVDTLGEAWAIGNHIDVKKFRADWDLHKKAAGPIRNNQMRDYADALIAIWDGKSKGTKHMIDIARKKGMEVYVLMV